MWSPWLSKQKTFSKNFFWENSFLLLQKWLFSNPESRARACWKVFKRLQTKRERKKILDVGQPKFIRTFFLSLYLCAYLLVWVGALYLDKLLSIISFVFQIPS